MADVVAALRAQKFSFEDLAGYQQWFHAEEIFDEPVRQEMSEDIDQQWHTRFAAKESDDMSQTPTYLVEDSKDSVAGKALTVSSAKAGDESLLLEEDAKAFKKAYFKDVQRVFSRVQHHMHKKTKKGYVPLKSCMRKGCKGHGGCKHDFPKDKFRFAKATLVCRGIASRYA